MPSTSRCNPLCEDLMCSTNSEALAWADLYMVVQSSLVMADDGRMIDEPLNYDGLRRIEKLKVFDKTNIVGSRQYQDASAPQYMDVGTLLHQYIWKQSHVGAWIKGVAVWWWAGCLCTKETFALVGVQSGLKSIKDEIDRWCNGNEYALQALTRLSQDVVKLDGLTNILATEGGDVAVQKRMQMIDMVRSMMNSIAIDGADEYDPQGLSLSGHQRNLEQFEIAVCGITGFLQRNCLEVTCRDEFTGRHDWKLLQHGLKKFHPKEQGQTEFGCGWLKCWVLAGNTIWRLPDTWHIEFEPLQCTKAEKGWCWKRPKQMHKRQKADAINTLINAQVLDATGSKGNNPWQKKKTTSWTGHWIVPWCEVVTNEKIVAKRKYRYPMGLEREYAKQIAGLVGGCSPPSKRMFPGWWKLVKSNQIKMDADANTDLDEVHGIPCIRSPVAVKRQNLLSAGCGIRSTATLTRKSVKSSLRCLVLRCPCEDWKQNGHSNKSSGRNVRRSEPIQHWTDQGRNDCNRFRHPAFWNPVSTWRKTQGNWIHIEKPSCRGRHHRIKWSTDGTDRTGGKLKQLEEIWVRENLDLIGSLEAETLRKLRDELTGWLLMECRRWNRRTIDCVPEQTTGSGNQSCGSIGSDQVGPKLNGRLMEYWQRSAGITEYRWQTMMDDRVRPLHADRQGLIF